MLVWHHCVGCDPSHRRGVRPPDRRPKRALNRSQITRNDLKCVVGRSLSGWPNYSCRADVFLCVLVCCAADLHWVGPVMTDALRRRNLRRVGAGGVDTMGGSKRAAVSFVCFASAVFSAPHVHGEWIGRLLLYFFLYTNEQEKGRFLCCSYFVVLCTTFTS